MATKEFDEVALDGSNYPTWASDIKISLASRGLSATIQEPQDGVVVQDKQIYTDLVLLHFYIHKDLKAGYIMMKILMNYGSLLKRDMNSKRNSFGLRLIMNGIIYVSKILNLWQTTIMLFTKFALN